MAQQPHKSSNISQLSARMTWHKVKIRTAHNKEEEDGKLVVSASSIGFVHNRRIGDFSIPTEAVTKVFYKNHYMTISFNDGKDLVGAVEFKLDKNYCSGVLRAVEEVTGVVLDQEGVKDK